MRFARSPRLVCAVPAAALKRIDPLLVIGPGALHKLWGNGVNNDLEGIAALDEPDAASLPGSDRWSQG